MSQFDQTTQRLKIEHQAERPYAFDVCHMYSLERGRNSAKESLEILARALHAAHKRMKFMEQWLEDHLVAEDFKDCQEIGMRPENYIGKGCTEIALAKTQVKARGDWPLETETHSETDPSTGPEPKRCQHGVHGTDCYVCHPPFSTEPV